MAKSKVKETTVPLKGEKKSKAPKASVTARAKPSQLSEENVIKSGSESESGSSGGGSDTESEDEKRQNTKKPNAKKVKATEPEAPAVPDDTSSEEDDSESESGSGSESDSESEKAKSLPAGKKSIPQTSGTKRKADESSSDEEESDDELPDAPANKKARKESEKEPSADKMEVDEPTLPAGVVARSVPAQPFQPPTGYTSLKLGGRSALTAKDLQDKQIWHITAPLKVPLSSLSEVALDAIQTRKPVLTHEDIEYVLAEDKTHQSSNENILLPGKEGYAPVSYPVSRTLHLRQHVELPNLSSKQADQSTGSNTAANVATAAVIGIRPQPRGMKMRYKPPGFGSEDPGRIGFEDESEDDGQEDGASAVFQFPKKIGMAGEPPTNPTIVETPKKVRKDKEKRDKGEKSEKKSRKKDKA